MKEKKPTYEQLILKLLESEPRWFYSYELVSRFIDGKWIGPSGDRIARYMFEEKKIERKGRDEHNGKYAQYRAVPKQNSIPSPLKMEFALPNKMAYNKDITNKI